MNSSQYILDNPDTQEWQPTETLAQISFSGPRSVAHILESITDGFHSVDRDWRFTYMNAQAERLVSRKSREMLGKSIWEEFPEAVGTRFEREYRRAAAEQTPVSFEEFYPPLGIWLEVRIFPSEDGLSVFFRDVTAQAEHRKREQFLAELAERARALNSPEAVIEDAVRSTGEFLGLSRCTFADIDFGADTCAIRTDYCANGAMASITGVFPLSSFGSFIVSEMQAGRPVVVDDVHLDLVRVPADIIALYESIDVRAHVTVPVVHSACLVSCIGAHNSVPRHWKPEEVALLQTVVQRTWMTVAVLRQERALKHEAEATARILRSITDAFFTLDREWRFIHINDQAEYLMTKPRAEIMGQIFWEAFPALVGTQFESEYRRAVNGNVNASFEIFYPPLNSWLEIRAYPSESGLSVFFQDITEKKNEEEKRRQRERRERFLADLAEQVRVLTDPEAVITATLEAVGKFLGVARCAFVDIDLEADTCTAMPDYRADDSVVSIAGVFPISDFGDVVVAEYGAGHAVVVEDVHAEPDQVPPENIAAYDALGIRAHLGVPVVHSSRLVSCIGVHSSVPRRWQAEEIELVRVVVERTWLTIEVTRQERALRRGAEERRLAQERTARMLESITDAFFTLGPEWHFTYVNTEAERVLLLPRAYLLGRKIWDVFPKSSRSVFGQQYRRAMKEGVVVTFEAFYPPLEAWLEVRAYPSPDGLSVFFQNVNERKMREVEQARLAEREHNIAMQLQTSLTPIVPEHIPGMALTKHYKAALEEAGVGGDFYDVFPVDNNRTALVVGDLSGKGLAAATQVATIRNMLRYAIYRARTLAGALGGLNALLAEQNLLTSFCTLFVGVYDSSLKALRYVNCGQEPALVRRSGGTVEQLPPTGPVLGSFDGAIFEERKLVLEPGDALAIFTDGLTEVGKSRPEMLGVEGIAEILEGSVVSGRSGSAESMAVDLALDLIARVDAAAAGGFSRDDVCLLVGVVE